MSVTQLSESNDKKLSEALDRLEELGFFEKPDVPYFCGKYVVTVYPVSKRVEIRSHTEGSKFRLDLYAEIVDRELDIKEPMLLSKSMVAYILDQVADKLKG